MRINYENYPILKKLEEKSLGVLPVFEKDQAFIGETSKKFVETWKNYREDFNKKIYAISPAFIEAKEKAEDKLLGILQDIMINDISDFEVKGTFLINNFVYMISYTTVQGSQDIELSFFAFDKNGVPLFYYHDSANQKIHQEGWISQAYGEIKSKEYAQKLIQLHLLNIVFVSMFASYAQVETKELLPKIKIKDSTGKYLNETSKNITYLDSKWFTTLVKSEGFLVRGHFRLQPKKKDGVWTKELIWIDSFEKEGYTAPAKKLSQ